MAERQLARASVRDWLSSWSSSRAGSAPSRPCSARIWKRCPSTRSMRSPTGSIRCRSAPCRSSPPAARSAQSVDGGRLLARVQGPAAISALLTGIIAVDTLPEALAKRRTLLSGESVITRDGIWIGRDWLRVSRDKDVHAGVIGREKEMRALRDVVADGRASSATSIAGAARRVAREACRARTASRRAAGRGQSPASRRTASSSAQVGALRTKAEQTAERVRRIGAETEELERDHREPRRAPSRKRAHACRKASRRWREFETARVELEQEREELRQNLSLQALAGADRSRRRAGSRDQGRVEALGAARRFRRASSGCAISSSSCSSGATS